MLQLIWLSAFTFKPTRVEENVYEYEKKLYHEWHDTPKSNEKSIDFMEKLLR